MSDASVLELVIRALRKDTLAGSGQRGVLGESLGWSSVLAGLVKFLLPSLLPSPSRRACVVVPWDASWFVVPRIVGPVSCLFFLIVHACPSFFEEGIKSPGGSMSTVFLNSVPGKSPISNKYLFMWSTH